MALRTGPVKDDHLKYVRLFSIPNVHHDKDIKRLTEINLSYRVSRLVRLVSLWCA